MFFILLLITFIAVPAALGDSPFHQALPGRVLTFPADHGKHSDFQTEWWYFTGNIVSDGDRKWGFQLTFFRRGVVREPGKRKSAWAVQDLYPAHFALTDVKTGRFFHTDMLSREGPGLAQAASDRLFVKVKDWTAEQRGDRIYIRALKNGYALDLKLVPQKTAVLHGDRGYSRKGDSETQASHYYSFTRLRAEGNITFDSESHSVTGSAWMDHEFGSSIVSEDQIGWDWFSLQLDDGTELMAFRLRRRDGSFEQPFGTFVASDGNVEPLSGSDLLLRSTAQWTSPRTKAVYPSAWTIEVPRKNLILRISPQVADQELTANKSTGVTYWEGAVAVEGTSERNSITGSGYVELTGYAHSMSGRL